MKLRFISAFCIFLVVLALFSTATPVFADEDTTEFTKPHAEKGLLSQAEYARYAGSSQHDWEALSAAILGDKGKEYLYALIRNLPRPDCNNVTDLHRSAVLIYAMGGNPRFVGGRDLIAEGVFYRSNLGGQGTNGYIWALIALDAYPTKVPEDAINTRESIVNALIELQSESGGFTIGNGKNDIDVTAMAVTALAKYRSDEKVNTAILRALAWISKQQQPDGDFSSWGVANAESTAQVIIALRTLGIDIFADKRFIKNGNTVFDGLMKYYRDGGFAHTVDGTAPTPFATGQGFCALAAVEKGGSIFDFGNLTLATVDQAAPENKDESAPEGISFKIILISAISAIGLIAAVAIGIKRKSLTAFIVIISAFALLVIILGFIKIQTPEEYYKDNLESVTPDSETVTISITCESVINSPDFNKTLIDEGYIPKDGIILPCTELVLKEGDSVFSILQRAVKHFKIQLEYSGGVNNAYVEGISHLYEFDCGTASGWIYKVNGSSPNSGISQYSPKDGDKIEIAYVLYYN